MVKKIENKSIKLDFRHTGVDFRYTGVLTPRATMDFFSSYYDYIIVNGKAVCRGKSDGVMYLFKDLKVIHARKETMVTENVFEKAFVYWSKNVTDIYHGFDFNPSKIGHDSKYNLWSGFKYEQSAEGNCDLFLDHLKWCVCNGNGQLYEYILDWFAQIIQTPEQKIGKVLALSGKQGTGKSIIGEIFAELFADEHTSKFNRIEDITHTYNGDLINKVFIMCEETFWGGNNKSRSQLKDLITSPTLTAEDKYKPRFQAKNVLRFFLTSNEEWMAPVEEGDRRYIVVSVNDAHQNDTEYFSNMITQLENQQGYEKLLYVLKNRDLSNRDFNQIPDTEVRRRHIYLGLKPLKKYIYESLLEGGLAIKEYEWEVFKYQQDSPDTNDVLIYAHHYGTSRTIEAQTLFSSYMKWARGNGHLRKHYGDFTTFIDTFRDIFGKDVIKMNSVETMGSKKLIHMPEIELGREMFFESIGLYPKSDEDETMSDDEYLLKLNIYRDSTKEK
jgi:Family of unknown function (DUF5906)